MHWLSILLLSIASNMDNWGIGLSMGLRSIRIPILSNVTIAFITMAGTLAAMETGSYISGIMHKQIANDSGGAVMILLGCWSLWKMIKEKRNKKNPASVYNNRRGSDVTVLKHPDEADINHDQIISWRESLMLGLALAFNNIATGFGAGTTGISPMPTTILTGLFSILFIGMGCRIGQTASHTVLGRYAEFTGALLLVLIGLYEIMI